MLGSVATSRPGLIFSIAHKSLKIIELIFMHLLERNRIKKRTDFRSILLLAKLFASTDKRR